MNLPNASSKYPKCKVWSMRTQHGRQLHIHNTLVVFDEVLQESTVPYTLVHLVVAEVILLFKKQTTKYQQQHQPSKYWLYSRWQRQ